MINFWYKAFQNVIVWIICTELYSIHLLATLVCPLAKDPRSKNLKNYLVESKDVKIRSNYGWIIGSPRSEITSLRICPEIPDHIPFTEFHFGTEYYTTRIGANGLIQDFLTQSLMRASNMGPRSWKCVTPLPQSIYMFLGAKCRQCPNVTREGVDLQHSRYDHFPISLNMSC